jgi:hypothetical protein
MVSEAVGVEAVGVEAVKLQHFAWTDPPSWLARQAAMHVSELA